MIQRSCFHPSGIVQNAAWVSDPMFYSAYQGKKDSTYQFSNHVEIYWPFACCPFSNPKSPHVPSIIIVEQHCSIDYCAFLQFSLQYQCFKITILDLVKRVMKTVLFPFLLTSKIFVLCTEAVYYFVFIALPVVLPRFLSYSLPIQLPITMKLAFFFVPTYITLPMTNTEPYLTCQYPTFPVYRHIFGAFD